MFVEPQVLEENGEYARLARACVYAHAHGVALEPSFR
jgi:hypothetical protein